MKPVMEMLFADPRLVGREMVNGALRALRDPQARASLARIAAAMHAIDGDGASLLATPRTQVIWGDRDRIVPLTPQLEEKLGPRLHLIRGGGHMPHVEKADEVNALIAGFVTG